MSEKNLFSEIDPSFERENQSLKTHKASKVPLSKGQSEFNRHSKKIEQLRYSIKSRENELNDLLSYFNEHFLPHEIQRVEKLVALVKSCYVVYNNEKFTKRQQAIAEDMLNGWIDDACGIISADEEIIDIYNRINEVSFDEEIKQRQQEELRGMESFFESVFGINVDLSEEDLSSAESMEEKLASIKEQLNNKLSKNTARKKTKKQMESEERRKLEEELKKKSIRSIYLSLAKLLHPDLVTDEMLKAEREILIKKVTTAYQNNDMYSLLKLESEIMYRQSENLNRISEDKLSLINKMLKEQISELQNELFSLQRNPRYIPISDYLIHPVKVAQTQIRKGAEQTKQTVNDIEQNLVQLSGSGKLKHFKQLIQKHEKAANEDKDACFDDKAMIDFINFMKYNS